MTDLIDQLIADWQTQRNDIDPKPMAVVGRILYLGRQLEQKASDALKPFELQYTELDVLATLRRKASPHQLNPKQLMATVLISSGAMTACLDRLEKRKLIKRIADPNDRRGRLIVLTAAGQKLIDVAIKVRFEQAAASTNGLSDKEQATLAKLLAKLIEAQKIAG
jgi:DNA-binding MarR family transcriptional regulator